MGKELNGKLLKEIRKADGLRQTDLASLCDLSERSIRDAERGRPVGIDVATRIAAALLVEPMDQLFAAKALKLQEVKRRSQPNQTPKQQPASSENKPFQPPSKDLVEAAMIMVEAPDRAYRYLQGALLELKRRIRRNDSMDTFELAMCCIGEAISRATEPKPIDPIHDPDMYRIDRLVGIATKSEMERNAQRFAEMCLNNSSADPVLILEQIVSGLGIHGF